MIAVLSLFSFVRLGIYHAIGSYLNNPNLEITTTMIIIIIMQNMLEKEQAEA